MRFDAKHVSASADGDYYQLWLGPEEANEDEADSGEVKEPYLIVQRQFEMPDRGECYIEMRDEGYIGHFRLRLTELSRTRLAFEIERTTNSHVEVAFSLNATAFEEMRRVGKIVFELRELEPGDDDGAL